MLSSRYSSPEFDPYGNSVPNEVAKLWPAPLARNPIVAHVTPPGSKSLTNRELVLSALASGPSVLREPLHSRDTALMIAALRSFGTTIEELPSDSMYGPDLVVTPRELLGSTSVDVGLAGTVMRFLPPLAALALGPTTFNGDAGARARPMAETVASLRSLGVDIADEGHNALPFTVHGLGHITGGARTIDASLSSQFVSGLLLAAPRFEKGLRLRHKGGQVPSQPHIEMTMRALSARGVKVESPSDHEWIVRPGAIRGTEVTIEPDLSSAAPFLAAAIVTGGSVTIDGWPLHTSQAGALFLDVATTLGATVTLEPEECDGEPTSATLTVVGGTRIKAADLDLRASGELAPVIVALAALANKPSRITGIGHIRNHETNRLAALAAEINGLGGEVTELDDGLLVTPRPLHGGEWHSYQDHRMAQAGAVIGLNVPGVEIHDIETTSKTMPEFAQQWIEIAGPDGP